MKKFLIFVLAFIPGLFVHAQPSDTNEALINGEHVEKVSNSSINNTDLNRIWGRTKFFDIRYDWSKMREIEGKDVSLKADIGFSFVLGNTYLLHKKPLWGMVKFGLDAIWFDTSFISYPKKNVFDGDGWDVTNGFRFDLGMGVGPSINVAPFSNFDNALKFLKLQVYFHFTPSFSLLNFDSEVYNKKENHFAFSPFINFGGVVTWKMIGIGVEGRWCTGRYSGFYEESSKFKSDTGRFIIRFCW